MSVLVRFRTSARPLGSSICLFKTLTQTRLYHADEGIYGHKGVKKNETFSVSSSAIHNRIDQSNLFRLVSAYRKHGYKRALVDPLGLKKPKPVEELDPSWYGLDSSNSTHRLEGILHTGQDSATTAEVIDALEKLYCGPLTAEFSHLPDLAEREWFATRYEKTIHESITVEEKVDMAKLMLKSQAFDVFLANKFGTVKRYGGEGAESAMCFYYELFRLASEMGIKDIVTCIAHRGRLNLLTCLLDFPLVTMFQKMRGMREFPTEVAGAGDVLSHLTSSVDLDYHGNKVHVTMVPNPSHLEAVNPVAAGKARARSQSRREGEYSSEEEHQAGDSVLCFQIHGDAAFSAQGVVAETFAISNVPHYTVGGTVHFIVNNQIGFTTPSERGRSSENTSDIGKMTHCPVIRVNADYPEEVLKASRLALEYRQKFRKDIVVDFLCFRKWGHNEMDDPSFTQPGMYNIIRSRDSIPDVYAKRLVDEDLCKNEELTEAADSWKATLADNFNQIDSHIPKANHLEHQWAGLVQAPPHISRWDTGVDGELLKYVGAQSVTVPEDFNTHSHIVKTHIEKRKQRLLAGSDLDWATAEAMAFGSLLYQGFDIRISGQDVGRGTFSHRHAMLVDSLSNHAYIPLNNINPDQTGFLEVGNSVLSEEAVLGFEYGVSIENPNILAIWEAQFGDFFNGAQIIIDTFVSGGETKWLMQSGLVMLLPHGIDGAGPEHSSSHLERFLQMTDSKQTGVDGDNINMQVVFPTTPAQYFHLLRRQMVRNFRKPLIVASPKGLLRYPACVSSLSEMQPGTSFKPVLGDSGVKDPSKVKKVIFVCGKHYFTLEKEREVRGVEDTALVRVEELCPFPAEDIRTELNKYTNATDFVWSQEEHRNQGAWNFVDVRYQNIVGCKLRYVGREVLATPATGVGLVHQQEVKQLIDDSFA